MEAKRVLFLRLITKRKRAYRAMALRAKRALRRREAFRRRQAQHRMLFVLYLCSYVMQVLVPIRTVWMNERTDDWWKTIVNNTFSPHDWLTNFRMSQATFDYICSELKDEIEKNTTIMRNSISTRMRVAVTLWFLATNADYRTIGHLFGISKASVCLIRRDVCRAIVAVLLPKYIRIPVGSALTSVMNGFERRGFPQCGGAIDGSHIPIKAPRESPADYHNRKGWHSIILQAMVDDVGKFTDICVGWPGRVHDARVFHNSHLFTKGERGVIFENRFAIINSTRVPVVVLGDPAYPLRPWLMKPFINSGSLTVEQQELTIGSAKQGM